MDIINGTHNYQQTDFQTYGQVPIDWAWLWSSNHGTTGSLGNRIHFSYDTQLIVDRQYGELRYRGPNGNELVFPWIFEGEESLDPVNRLFLTAGAHSYKMEDLNTGLTYLYVRSRQNRACYLLSEIRNAAGFALTIQRNEQEQILQLLDSNQFLVNIRYNAQGFIQSLSTEEERIVSYHYSAEGNLIEVIDALNNVQKFIYDTNHLIEQLRQSDGIKRHWRYDSYGRLVHQWTDGHLDEYWFEYDEAQQRNRKRDYYGNETEYDYNEFGLIDRIKHYQGGTERFFYNEQFQLIEQRLIDGQVIQYTYDQSGLLQTKTYSDGTAERFTYNRWGSVIQQVARNGRLTRFEYNEQRALTQVLDNEIEVFSAQYSSKTNLIENVKSAADTASFSVEYDRFGRVSQRKSRSNNETFRWTYNAIGQCVTHTKAQGVCSLEYTCTYDKKQRLVTLQQGRKMVRAYTHNTVGLVTEIVVNGQLVRLSYDSGKRVSSIQTPAKDDYTFFYNHFGELLEVKKNKRQIYFAERNQLRQIVKEVYENAFEKTFEYDRIGRVQKVLFGNGVWTEVHYDPNGYIDRLFSNDKTWELYENDSVGNIIRAKNFFGELHLSYDRRNQLTEERMVPADSSLPETFVTYDYFEDGTLKQHSILGLLTETYERSAAGYIRETTLLNKQKITCEVSVNENKESIHFEDVLIQSEYTSGAELLSQTVTSQEKTTCFEYEYTEFDQLQRINNESEKQVVLFNYDERQRLTHISENGATILQRIFDQQGMKETRSRTTLETDKMGRVIETNQARYVYDEQGNVLERKTKEKHEIFSYTASGQLIRMDSSEQDKTLFFHDCFGRLCLILREQSIQQFIWSKDQVVLEINSQNGQPAQITQWLYARGKAGQLVLAVNSSGTRTYNLTHVDADYPSISIEQQGERQEFHLGHALSPNMKIRHAGLSYRSYRLIDEGSNRFIQRSPLQQLSVFSDNYETTSKQAPVLSLEEHQALDEWFIQMHDSKARMLLIRLLFKDRQSKTAPRHNYLDEAVFDVEHMTQNELMGLDEFGIFTVEQLLGASLEQRLENYLNKAQR